jgi:hypothetical protein
MKIGFTGTRDGMTEAQMVAVENILRGFWRERAQVHHGCCVGADATFHETAQALGIVTVGHPAYPIGHEMRADLECDMMHDILPPLERNQAIVDLTDLIIATPFQDTEVQRSGTWATLRYSFRVNKARCIVTPDGSAVWQKLREE